MAYNKERYRDYTTARGQISRLLRIATALPKLSREMPDYKPASGIIDWDDCKHNVFVSCRNGKPSYAIVTGKTPDGNYKVCHLKGSQYLGRHEFKKGSFGERELLLVPQSLVDDADNATRPVVVTDPPAIPLLLSPPKLAEALDARSKSQEVIKHEAALPKSLSDDLSRMKAMLEGVSDNQTKLWSDYVDLAERLERKMDTILEIMKAIPCESGRQA